MYFVRCEHGKSKKKILNVFDLINLLELKRTHLLKEKKDFGYYNFLFQRYLQNKNLYKHFEISLF